MPSARDDARTAWGFGIAAVLLAMVAPCMSYMPALIAVPLGLVAMSKAKQVLAEQADEATEAYARTGQILGIAGAVWSTVLLLFIGAILLMYAAMFALILMEGL
jgi:hypothetical protein